MVHESVHCVSGVDMILQRVVGHKFSFVHFVSHQA